MINKKNMINFFKCSHDVYEDIKFKELPLSAKHLYTTLSRLANRLEESDGWFYRSLKNLSEDTNMSSHTISNAKKILEKNNFIDIRRGYYEHTKQRTYDYFRLNGFRFKLDS